MGCITADHASSNGPISLAIAGCRLQIILFGSAALLFMLSDCWHQLGDFAAAEFPFFLRYEKLLYIWAKLAAAACYYR